MRLKNMLGDIQPDYANFRHGRLPQVVFNTSTVAHRCRRGASTPSLTNQSIHSVGADQLDKVGAVVEAGYPGGCGGEAIAVVLTGRGNPSGHLPVSFPRNEGQLARPKVEGPLNPALYPTEAGPKFDLPYREGADVGYQGYALSGETPLFPFGFGLTYTQFAMDELRASGGKQPKITFTVRNIGTRSGAAVPQVYLANGPKGKITRLLGWEKVPLWPGASQMVTLRPDPRLFAEFDVAARSWKIRSGKYAVSLGSSAETFPNDNSHA